ncbi:hypothetical protein K1719_042030 [Acacia pycnantha]|nr:hypothetical protein K1719_042030 [Acacia pycnantha]
MSFAEMLKCLVLNLLKVSCSLVDSLVAAFRSTLEEISESSLLVHVVDIGYPLSEQQIDVVDKVLSELNVSSIPRLMVWNKVDKASDPQKIRKETKEREDVVCISWFYI